MSSIRFDNIVYRKVFSLQKFHILKKRTAKRIGEIFSMNDECVSDYWATQKIVEECIAIGILISLFCFYIFCAQIKRTGATSCVLE